MLEEGRELGDRADVGRVDALHRARLGDRGRARHDGLGGLDVGGPTALAVHEFGLAALGERHELGRDLAADLAGLGDDRAVLEAETLADAAVRSRLRVVVLLERLLRGVEGVRVLHDELAAAEQTETRAHLVAELRLDLIERDRKVAIGAQLAAHEHRDDLLVRRAEAEVAIVAVLEAREFGAVEIPSARLLPDFGRLDDRHHHLLAADAVHLLAHDVLDLDDRPPGQRQEVVDAARDLADHAGAQQQAMRGEFRLGWDLLQRRGIQRAHAQGDSHRDSPSVEAV